MSSTFGIFKTQFPSKLSTMTNEKRRDKHLDNSSRGLDRGESRGHGKMNLGFKDISRNLPSVQLDLKRRSFVRAVQLFWDMEMTLAAPLIASQIPHKGFLIQKPIYVAKDQRSRTQSSWM